MSDPTQQSFKDYEPQLLIDSLIEQRDELVNRLDAGMAKIEKADAEGKDTTKWKTHWCNLLLEYERISDKVRELGDK